MSKAKKAARAQKRVVRQTGRQERKMVKTTGKVQKKQTRVEGRNAKKLAKVQGSINSEMKNDPEVESKILKVEELREQYQDITPEAIEPKILVKAKRYLERQGVEDIDNDPAVIAAQFSEARQKQVLERNRQDRAAELAQMRAERPAVVGMSGEDTAPDYSPEDEELEEDLPDLEDTEEEIMEEEENQFSFDGDEDNFVDPSTIAILLNSSKAGLDKLRDNRFSKGKTYFGMTKTAYDKKQAQKAAIQAGTIEDPSVINAVKKQAEKDVTKQTIRDYTPEIIAVSILIIIGLVVAYKSGKK